MPELSQRIAALIEKCDELEVRLVSFAWASRQMVLQVEQYVAEMAEKQTLLAEARLDQAIAHAKRPHSPQPNAMTAKGRQRTRRHLNQ